MTTQPHRCIAFATWLVVALLASASAVHAQDASAWSDDSRSSLRLIAGNKTGATLRAGVEIKLNPGWKTYWRYPGDSGLPPTFDTSKSDNVENVTVLWPAPHRFTDESGNSIGYKDSVIFPLRVKPRDPSKPVTLRAEISYAVCEKLCIPAHGRAELVLTGNASTNERALAEAEALVPQPAELGAKGTLAIRSIRRVTTSPKPLVAVEVTAPDGGAVELFAEGPNADWALPVPMPAQGAPKGTAHFGFGLDGLPAGVDPNNKEIVLTLTLVAGKKAIEVKTRLD